MRVKVYRNQKREAGKVKPNWQKYKGNNYKIKENKV